MVACLPFYYQFLFIIFSIDVTGIIS
uniref:Uncharacterized protein n=1 Tax=Rhizophora mucronata TaxID=61149 RepID=A0A2P2QAA3_RHIMU